MRFARLHTMGDDAMFPPGPPDETLYEKMDAFVNEATKAGVIVATGGMAPIAQGIKVTLHGRCGYTVVDNPFAEAKKIVGGWELMEVRDRDGGDRVDRSSSWPSRARASRGSGRSSGASDHRGSRRASGSWRCGVGGRKLAVARRPMV